MPERGDDDYEVGYARPPKHSRWPKGVSGNPKGREKGKKGLKSDLEAELNAVGTVSGKDGWKKKGRQQRLAVATLCRRAAMGDLKAQAIFFPLVMQILGVEDRGKGPRKLSSQDQALLDELLESRMAEAAEGELTVQAGDAGNRLSPPPGAPAADEHPEGKENRDK